jgi:uncharacterized membrane protein YkoI
LGVIEVNKAMLVFGVLMSGVLTCGVSSVNAQTVAAPFTQVVEDIGQFPVAPSEAAMIARDSVPGSKVLNVKLLPSGVYAVTLKVGGSVTRVMVDATSGAVT